MTRRMRGGRPCGVDPSIICVVGYKDSGKTGVAVALVRELRDRGHRVGAVKHGHGFRLDSPGTDSWRLRNEGGASPVLLTGPAGYALMGSWDPDPEPDLETLVRRHFQGMDVVVAEGFKKEGFPKIGVHRAGLHPESIYGPGDPGADTFVALVTDATDLEVPIPLFAPDDPETPGRLADLLGYGVMA